MVWLEFTRRIVKYFLLIFSYFIPFSIPLGIPVFEMGTLILPFVMIIPTVLYTYLFIGLKPFRAVSLIDKLIALYPILGPVLLFCFVVV